MIYHYDKSYCLSPVLNTTISTPGVPTLCNSRPKRQAAQHGRALEEKTAALDAMVASLRQELEVSQTFTAEACRAAPATELML